VDPVPDPLLLRKTVIYMYETDRELYSESNQFEFRPDTGHPDRGYIDFPQFLQANSGRMPELGHYLFHPDSFEFIRY
jgi:hypothetical protein